MYLVLFGRRVLRSMALAGNEHKPPKHMQCCRIACSVHHEDTGPGDIGFPSQLLVTVPTDWRHDHQNLKVKGGHEGKLRLPSYRTGRDQVCLPSDMNYLLAKGDMSNWDALALWESPLGSKSRCLEE